MNYYRFNESFYNVIQVTQLPDDKVSVEYTEKVREHLPNHKLLPNGNFESVMSKAEWETNNTINKLEYLVWLHMKGDK